MRKIIISLLLAGVVATPAVAGPLSASRSDEPRSHRAERDESGPRRSDRSESFRERRAEPREAPRFEAREQPSSRPMTSEPGWVRRAPDDNPLHAGRGAVGRQNPAESMEQVQQRFERRQQAIRNTSGSARFVPPADEPMDRAMRRYRPGTRAPLIVSDVPRPGTQPPLRVERRRSPGAQWSDSWRRDHRYDWQQHRRRHRSLFHIGVYFDPFGWGYRPYQVGWRMWPSYYSSRYWINDPWEYRLPYAPPGYRWIRYWDDALLVDTWSGEVVDVIPNFFW